MVIGTNMGRMKNKDNYHNLRYSSTSKEIEEN